MSATEAQNASGNAGVGNVDMKLENQIFPVSDVDRSKQFYERWAGGSTTTSPRWTAFASSSSRPPARRYLDHVRQGPHDGGAWFGRDHRRRLRHRGGA